jgi:hypothetical protein
MVLDQVLIRAYYHAHLTDDPMIWSSIFIEQMKAIEDGGLLGHLGELRVTAITQDDNRNDMFINLCQSYRLKIDVMLVKNKFDSDKEMMHNRETNNSFTEDITLKRIQEESHNHNEKILYFHTKGSTSYLTNINQYNIVRHKEYYYWRSFMNWSVLKNWAWCENALGIYDIAGGDFKKDPSPHFSGNFWWSTADHIRKLPDPMDKSWWYNFKEKSTDPWIKQAPVRMYDEFWIGAREGIKAYDVVNLKHNQPMRDCLSDLDCERNRS